MTDWGNVCIYWPSGLSNQEGTLVCRRGCWLCNRHASCFRPCRPWACQQHTRSLGNQHRALQEITAFVFTCYTLHQQIICHLASLVLGRFIYCCCHDSGNGIMENCRSSWKSFNILGTFLELSDHRERGSWSFFLWEERRQKIPSPYKEKSQEKARTGIKRKMRTQIRKHREGDRRREKLLDLAMKSRQWWIKRKRNGNKRKGKGWNEWDKNQALRWSISLHPFGSCWYSVTWPYTMLQNVPLKIHIELEDMRRGQIWSEDLKIRQKSMQARPVLLELLSTRLTRKTILFATKQWW